MKIIDVYLVFIMASGITQFIYMAIVGNFPYNAFLSGFAATVGTFVLAGIFISLRVANLRIQFNPENKVSQTQERYNNF